SALATCTAAVHTAPVAPWIRIDSLGPARPRTNIARYAAAYGTPIAAPCPKLTFAGSRHTCFSPHSAFCAYAPLKDDDVYTRSPTFTPLTPCPTASTTPAAS